MAPQPTSNPLKRFGQTMQKTNGRGSSTSSSSSRYQRQFGNNRGSGRHSRIMTAEDLSNGNNGGQSQSELKAQEAAARRRLRQEQGEAIDIAFGYNRLEDHPGAAAAAAAAASTAGSTIKSRDSKAATERRGWLFHMLSTTRIDASSGDELSGLDLYFVDKDGETFKTTMLHQPYFYVLTRKEDETLGQLLMKRFAGTLAHVEQVPMVDLDQPNHLSPNHSTRLVWKLFFHNVSQLMDVRNQLQDILKKHNKNNNNGGGGRSDRGSAEAAVMDIETLLERNGHHSNHSFGSQVTDSWANVEELREYDVPYVVRVCMDLNIRAGSWYTVTLEHVDDDGSPPRPVLSDADIETKGNPRVLAFDIECSKAPLKFPNADMDEIYMISYMCSDGNGTPQGYLITSRSIVSQDVSDFEYTPKPTYPGPFHIFNEVDELALIRRFIEEFRTYRPQIVVTYNGDSFDWPFLFARAATHRVDLWKEIGMTMSGGDRGSEAVMSGGEVRGHCCVHLDAFCWVQRDSYLPQGAQGLKAVTKYKLGYDPVEVDPEDMLPMAQERPVHMATYSVSDAVATYYLYEKYVHLFIFSLCTLIPMGPEDVLRKGSGTLCETLLMVEANDKDIICPNKQVDPLAKFHKGHLLESETYIGGKVECLETGVYRSDVEYEFDLKPSAFQQLIDNIDRDLCFAIEVEAGVDRSEITNYEEVRSKIVEELELLRDRPKRVERPYIYHLDVGAMYPNIILTNRLQPSAIVDDATCAACDFNQEKNGCKRRMDWVWRGDYSPAGKLEYESTKGQLSREVTKDGRQFVDLSQQEQEKMVAARLKEYSRNAYRRTKITEEVTIKETVCMRENDFYVETVRRFRDRRYDYKKMTKIWKNKIGKAIDAASRKEAEDKTLVYDSLQVAHKCILNSFYGYVMRKGARWRSMEMAGIVTKTGADLITQARVLVEQIGRPLELDTDGIWCILPKSFPDVYTFTSLDGSKVKLEYPCVMLNADVHDNFTNHQYQTLKDPKRGTYETRSDNSIFFEVDGPYRCMVLPASTEEGKLLKKRYAVFNFDGSLAELKGFELKRRGELELIKTFQSQVFERFLDGNSLIECYDSVAEVANHWIDVIDTRGESLDDEELVDLISENRNMSRQLDDYGDQKGTSQTTARRLGEFLGAEIIKDKGLNCKFIIAEQPYGAPVTERAIPTAIWKAEPGVMKHFLRKWLKAPGIDGEAFDIRNVLDWDYYMERLAKTIQKIITIPAALQKVDNPVPRVAHPDWLHSKVRQLNDKYQQRSIISMFKPKLKTSSDTHTRRGGDGFPGTSTPMDIEDMAGKAINVAGGRPVVHRTKRSGKSATALEIEEENQDEFSDARVELRTNVTPDSFTSWLKQKKQLWKKSRKEKNSRRIQEGLDSSRQLQDRPPSQIAPATTVESFARQGTISLIKKEWQIIEIRESTASDTGKNHKSSSGEFAVWVMAGNEDLRKVQISVPRTVYIAAKQELRCSLKEVLSFRKVDKHLPHGKTTNFLYELTLPEYVYRNIDWTSGFSAAKPHAELGMANLLDKIYESDTPLLNRALNELGSVAKLTYAGATNKKVYELSDLKGLERPSEGLYLNERVSFRRNFLYVRMNAKNRTGLIALFSIKGGSGNQATPGSTHIDLADPSKSGKGAFEIGASCQLWVVKPNAGNIANQTISEKLCNDVFSELLATIQEAMDVDSEYACISPLSFCNVSKLAFVKDEQDAFKQVNAAIRTENAAGSGPNFMVVNSSKPTNHLRRSLPQLNNMPVISLPFPPGPDHNPTNSTLPSLNWEQPMVQLSFEACLHMAVVSFPRRLSCSRYGNVPIGNLGDDEHFTLYNVGLSRMLHKNRAISWASKVPGRPDLGSSFLPSSSKSRKASLIQISDVSIGDTDDIWNDDNELVSPVIRRPGTYRSMCIDLDMHDLAIAALTDSSCIMNGHSGGVAVDPASPTSVMQLDATGNNPATLKLIEPLGDEMSTATSLPILRALVAMWLRDAFTSNNLVADSMLHHVYRLVSSPGTLMHDAALHRAMHTLMKRTFLLLLGELQRLGCTIVHATFHKVTISTNKTSLADAEEYVNFVTQTIRKNDENEALARVSLRPRMFHTQLVFLDEYNYGTMHLERCAIDDADGTYAIEMDDSQGTVVVPSVVTAFSLINYIGSEIAQEYFRIVLGRFSKDIMKKEEELKNRNPDDLMLSMFDRDLQDQLLSYKKKLISKHFAAMLTRAVSDIGKEMEDEEENAAMHRLLTLTNHPLNPVLEFVKSVTAILELDHDIDAEVHALKRSLLSQIGVAEYSHLAKWENPCPTLMLPDAFCAECQESRDINLCYIPPAEDEEQGKRIHWFCEDCGTEYDVFDIERRLVNLAHKKMLQYQLQDLRCTKTNRVATHSLSLVSHCSAELKLDISQQQGTKEILTLHRLAEYHELENLRATTEGILSSFRRQV